jgi:hypothetical protein
MQSMWKRTRMINAAQVGRKIVEWTLDASTRPKTIEEFQLQDAGRARGYRPD